MSVKRIDWIALKIGSDSLEQPRAFGSALGLKIIVESETQIMFQAEDGGVVEFCSSRYVGPAHLFESQNSIFGFAVADINASAADLEKAGFEAVTTVTDGGPVFFQHFLGPDGRHYGLIEHKP